MALRALQEDPIRVDLVYNSHIQTVAYPFFERVAPAGKMTSGEPEEYQYNVGIGIKSYYLAHGELHSAHLDKAHYFIVQIEDPLQPNWRLSLGEESSRISGPPPLMPFYYLQLRNVGESRRRKNIADAINAAIENEFFHQDYDRPFASIRSPAYIRSLLTSVGQAAGPDYQHTLEQHIRENLKEPILPQKYRYDIDGNVFDKAKLVKV